MFCECRHSTGSCTSSGRAREQREGDITLSRPVKYKTAVHGIPRNISSYSNYLRDDKVSGPDNYRFLFTA
ncbi:hypothetical protein INT43_007683 [Umbelopsis isabellina]|uniref:Uncharacterized protein n=1 Tax=Mortierella isabellina TaxID=91625 RepID=A0A8H7PMP4_MORIS|nr:hypothetical protein INT43_007683 [Umbelopsis isabellina]